jgi:hypothetical protein
MSGGALLCLDLLLPFHGLVGLLKLRRRAVTLVLLCLEPRFAVEDLVRVASLFGNLSGEGAGSLQDREAQIELS